MKLFDINDNKIIITPEILLVPEFKAIYDSEGSDKLLRYVYNICDYNSSYSNLDNIKRAEHVGLDVMNDAKYKPTKEVQAAIDKYKLLSITSKERLFNAIKSKLDQITDYLNTRNVDDDSIKSILEIYKQLSATINNFDVVEEALKKEKLQSIQVRGNKKVTKYTD